MIKWGACTAALLLLGLASEPVVTARQNAGQPPWQGRLRIAPQERGFVDEKNDWVLPLCAHFGEAFSAYVRRPADVEDQLRAIRGAGYDCIRFWDNLGEYDGWRGREISPWSWTNADGVRVNATADYYARLRDFLAMLKRVGLAAHHSRGDLGRDKPHVPGGLQAVIEHSRRVAVLYDEVGWSVLALYEANNENFQNGNFSADDLRQIVQPIKDKGGLVASTASCIANCGADEVAAFARGFSVRYYHNDREGTATDRLHRSFTTTYLAASGTPRLAWEGEPIGPNNAPGLGVSVKSSESIEELGLLPMAAFIARSGYNYMSQYGVWWNGRIEQQSGFAVVPKMRAALRAFAPDVMSWPTIIHGGRPEAVLVSPIGYHHAQGAPEGPARLEQVISADRRRAVAIVYGGRGRKPVQNRLGCTATITVLRPRSDETVQSDTFTLEPGATLDLEYDVGRLLLARCQ